MEYDLYGAQKNEEYQETGRGQLINRYVQIPSINPDQWEEHFRNIYEDTSEINYEGPSEDTEEQNLIQNFCFNENNLLQIIRKLAIQFEN